MKAYYENRLYGDKLPFSISSSKGFAFLAHWHSDVEMIYVLDGQFRVGINQEAKLLNRGEMALATSGRIHYFDDTNISGKIMILIFHPKLVGFSEGWPLENYTVSPFILRNNLDEQRTNALDRIEQLMLSMEKEDRRPDAFTQYMITSMLNELCGLCLRYFSWPAEAPAKRSSIKANEVSQLQEMLLYIDKHYNSGLSLPHAAKQFNLSPSYFSKLIKKTLGMSFSSYLESRKILRAEKLLQANDKNITEIAYDCGFESIRTFNRIFKKINGCPPTQFQKLDKRTSR